MTVLEEIWEVSYEAMWRCSWRILKNAEDCEDAIMDAFVRMAANAGKFRPLPDDQRTALAVIYVRNTSIDIYHKKKNPPLPLADWDTEPIAAASEADPQGQAIVSDLEAQIAIVLRQMPAAMRDVLNLHIYYEYSIPEIADALAITPGTVRTRLSRGRKWLRENLKERGLITDEG